MLLNNPLKFVALTIVSCYLLCDLFECRELGAGFLLSLVEDTGKVDSG